MSVMLRISDSCRTLRHFRNGPIPDQLHAANLAASITSSAQFTKSRGSLAQHPPQLYECKPGADQCPRNHNKFQQPIALQATDYRFEPLADRCGAGQRAAEAFVAEKISDCV